VLTTGRKTLDTTHDDKGGELKGGFAMQCDTAASSWV
jgi:hypothetical protein